ncbi:MAG: NAD-dependent epimerase/dehydratase family protein [bacterium]
MRILVTGSHGFAGTHLRALLRARGDAIVGMDRLDAPAGTPGPHERYVRGDLLQPADLRAAVEEADPDLVFHLAALPGRGDEAEARRTLAVNVQGTANLLAALLDRGRPARVLHVASSAMYGAVPPEDDPVTETAPLRPLGVYGWSKVASEAVALAHNGRAGLEVVGARPFNHTGPGEPEHLATSTFAKQVAAIEAGAEPVIRVGWLDAVRDLADVRDIVRGYVALGDRGKPGAVYNLCSGRGTRIGDVLRMLLDKSAVEIEVRADSSARAGDLARQVGSFERARADVGWTPAIPLSESLDALLAEWRARYAARSLEGKRS